MCVCVCGCGCGRGKKKSEFGEGEEEAESLIRWINHTLPTAARAICIRNEVHQIKYEYFIKKREKRE